MKYNSSDYLSEAKSRWGEASAYKEYEKKNLHRTPREVQNLGERLLSIFADLGKLKNFPPEERCVQEKIQELQTFITAHYYTCTDEILLGLADLYTAGDAMAENIDKAGGSGTADFAAAAIRIKTAGK